MLQSYLTKNDAASLVEYALVLLLIAIVLLVLVVAPGLWASAVYSKVDSSIVIP